MIHDSRLRALNDHSAPADGDYVLYWMQASQRESCNHALEHAIDRANDLGLRLAVGFGLMDDYPEANLRHYRFMVEGLVDLSQRLSQRNIKLVLRHGHPAEVAIELGRAAAEVICDRGYLAHQKQWREKVAAALDCPVVEVETDTVVPIHSISEKAEYAARTMRPKIHRLLEEYLQPLRRRSIDKHSLNLRLSGMALSSADAVLERLQLDRSVGAVSDWFIGGYGEARKRLDDFLDDTINDYAEKRSEPVAGCSSTLSPYLHFGHISPLEIALAVRHKRGTRSDNKNEFLEELLVRRALAQNFCEFTDGYDRYSALPEWARRTLDDHRGDERPHRYTAAEMEAGQTHDEYFNAAMREMRVTGFMHSYMRMYWGKKILEWTNTPEYGFRTTLELNNKYFLDGRDPNSYTNVAWIYGVHDRPWTERPIFGKVRYMAASGLERKFDIAAYVEKIRRL